MTTKSFFRDTRVAGFTPICTEKGEIRMSNTRFQWTFELCLGPTSTALALVIVIVLGLVGAQPAQAQTFSVLYNFTGLTDGGDPYGALVRDGAGNLYGTGSYAGKFNGGVVFKVDTTGKETVLYAFTEQADGEFPFAGLVRDKAGNLYGTTTGSVGGSNGTVFKVDSAGNETTLYSFAGGTTDGSGPYGALLRDKLGNLYGVTDAGGTFGNGIIYKVNKSKKETVLHNFTGGNDGGSPSFTSLIMDAKGNFYGVTPIGGTLGNGIVYKLSLSPHRKLTVLHNFAGGTKDGCDPYGALAMDKQGNLYGTTVACGASSMGTVWKLSPAGKETVLYNFKGGSSDGGFPQTSVIMDAHGNLYGDTTGGGPANDGIVFKLSSRRKFTLLHSFTGPDGQFPHGDLIRDAKGTLYGTTINGGSGKFGTVWQITAK
jgi:uncharacterized repeat protein (TIGR03803 family)